MLVGLRQHARDALGGGAPADGGRRRSTRSTNSTYRQRALSPATSPAATSRPSWWSSSTACRSSSSSFGFAVGEAGGLRGRRLPRRRGAVPRRSAAGATLVVTSDRDRFQLASDSVTILLPKRGVAELERVGPAEVRERYGVEPAQVPDFIALRGDPSDRMPGAPGIGPAKAAAILREHGTLEGRARRPGASPPRPTTCVSTCHRNRLQARCAAPRPAGRRARLGRRSRSRRAAGAWTGWPSGSRDRAAMSSRLAYGVPAGRSRRAPRAGPWTPRASTCSMSAERLGPETIASELGRSPPTRANSSSRPGSTRSSAHDRQVDLGQQRPRRAAPRARPRGRRCPGRRARRAPRETVAPGSSGTTR